MIVHMIERLPAFTEEMRRRLEENAHKDGVFDIKDVGLPLGKLIEEVGVLSLLCMPDHEGLSRVPIRTVHAAAADVANMAMIAAAHFEKAHEGET